MTGRSSGPGGMPKVQPAIPDVWKVSRHGLGAVGPLLCHPVLAPTRVKQDFCCTKSAMSAPSMHLQTLSVCICRLCAYFKLKANKCARNLQMHTMFRLCHMPQAMPRAVVCSGLCPWQYQVCRCTLYAYNLCRQFAHLVCNIQ